MDEVVLSPRRILPMPLVLAHQIAAGEVIVRPASVVKELLENAIDAQAKKIEVEIEGSGIYLIRVRDNGIGIVKHDLSFAFLRNATSKLYTLDDLASIKSLGFRGEALASIACIARCRLISRAVQAEQAWQIQMRPDLTHTVSPAAHPVGTTVEVMDLFYNTPVRRKFLRSEKTEFQAIEETFRQLALANPDIHFYLRHEKKVIRHYVGHSTVDAKLRVGKICGVNFLENAYFIERSAVGLHLKGWLGRPALCQRHTHNQYFYVNGRIIKDKLLSHAVKSIYVNHTDYAAGTYPSFVLFLSLDPKEMDVNVHPTKQEVRFHQSRLIYDFVAKCVDEALCSAAPSLMIPPTPFSEGIEKLNTSGQVNRRTQNAQPLGVQFPLGATQLPCNSGYQQTERNVNMIEAGVTEKLPVNRAVPTPHSNRYICLEDVNGIKVIDLYKEKIAIGEFYFQHYGDQVTKQTLLFPLVIDYQGPVVHEAVLKEMGFCLCKKGERLRLMQVPMLFKAEDLQKLMLSFLAEQHTLCHKEGVYHFFATHMSEQALGNLSPATRSSLLSEWLRTHALATQWCHFSHEDIRQQALRD